MFVKKAKEKYEKKEKKIEKIEIKWLCNNNSNSINDKFKEEKKENEKSAINKWIVAVQKSNSESTLIRIHTHRFMKF